jgi:methylated-DNA-protein-cysteine methyltransferase-like protein
VSNQQNPSIFLSYTLYDKIYHVVRQVPPGRVASYGDIAQIVGGGCDPRIVGQALNEIPKRGGEEVPWQRVVNKQGGISTRGLLQRQLLEAEGVLFGADERIDMRRFRWHGPTAEWAAAHGFATLPPLPPDEPGAEQLPLF